MLFNSQVDQIMYSGVKHLQIIVLEDTKEYIGYAPKKDIEAQDRRAFDLLVR